LSEWSFQRKLTSGLILICLLAIVTSVGALFASRVLISNMSQADGGAAQTLAEAKAIQLAGVRNIAMSHACLLTGGARFVRMAQGGQHAGSRSVPAPSGATLGARRTRAHRQRARRPKKLTRTRSCAHSS
jgi:hypothetical protein